MYPLSLSPLTNGQTPNGQTPTESALLEVNRNLEKKEEETLKKDLLHFRSPYAQLYEEVYGMD